MFHVQSDDQIEPDVPAQNSVGAEEAGGLVCLRRGAEGDLNEVCSLMMKRKTSNLLLFGFLMGSALIVVGYIGIWVSSYPLVDAPPKGEGSFEELDTVFKQFRKYDHTKNAVDLPEGYVHVAGWESEEPDAKETWMIYYATASHSFRRGGTIVLMGSDGQIDGYFGHHCSKSDGGTVILSQKTPSSWTGDGYFNGLEGVRQTFGNSFKHQRTEQRR